MPKKPTRSHCSARPTASEQTGTDPIFLNWEKWGLSLFFLLAGCGSVPLEGIDPGATYFGLLGDTPYSEGQALRLDRLIDDMNAQPLSFVAHVGDVGTSMQACGDGWLAERKKQLARIRHPFVLLPGDNEWSDCHQHGADPAERLAKWRQAFCSREKVPGLERQPGPYCEHVRWRAGDTLFVALNVPGNNNNARQPAEHEARTRALLRWIDDSASLSPSRLVLLMQANPFVPRQGYAALVHKLESLAGKMPGRVMLVHGDTHLYRDDEPLPGLRRVEVWGAPWVSWLRGSLGRGELRVESAGQY